MYINWIDPLSNRTVKTCLNLAPDRVLPVGRLIYSHGKRFVVKWSEKDTCIVLHVLHSGKDIAVVVKQFQYFSGN